MPSIHHKAPDKERMYSDSRCPTASAQFLQHSSLDFVASCSNSRLERSEHHRRLAAEPYVLVDLS
jgi:hypothetical protein